MAALRGALCGLLGLSLPLGAFPQALVESQSFDFDGSGTNGWFADPDNTAYFFTQKRGLTPSPGTGPDFDHTTMDTNGGSYMFVESSCDSFGCSAVCPSGRTAAIRSQSFLSADIGAVSFWYHMYGVPENSGSDPTPCDIGALVTMGDLFLDVLDENGEPLTTAPRVTIRGADVSSNSSWQFQEPVYVPPSSGRIQIRIRAVLGPHWASDIAFDDVTVYVRNAASDALAEDGLLLPPDDGDDDDDPDRLLLTIIVLCVVGAAAVCSCFCYYCFVPWYYRDEAEAADKASRGAEPDVAREFKVSAKRKDPVLSSYDGFSSHFRPVRLGRTPDITEHPDFAEDDYGMPRAGPAAASESPYFYDTREAKEDDGYGYGAEDDFEAVESALPPGAYYAEPPQAEEWVPYRTEQAVIMEIEDGRAAQGGLGAIDERRGYAGDDGADLRGGYAAQLGGRTGAWPRGRGYDEDDNF